MEKEEDENVVTIRNENGYEVARIRDTDLDKEVIAIKYTKKGDPFIIRYAGFLWIKKVNATILDWTGRNQRELIEIEIKSLNPNSQTNNTLERFVITDNQNTYWELFSHIKEVRRNQDVIEVAKAFYRDVIVKENKFVEDIDEVRCEMFGMNGAGDVILPTTHKLDKQEKFEEDNDEFFDFLKVFEKEIPNKAEMLKVIEVLHRYLKNDDISKVVFAYTMISPYRVWLLNTKYLPEFPYLLLTSFSSDRGKTARCKLLINRITLGTYGKGSNSGDDLAGSAIRMQDKQYITANWNFEEVVEFEKNFGLFKDLATTPKFNTKKGEKTGKTSFTQTIIRGSITMSNNNNDWSKIPKALLDRIIVLNLENVKKPYEGVDKDYQFLMDNGPLLTRYIWENLERYKDVIDFDDMGRNLLAQKYVLRNGLKIVNALFKDFNLEPIELDIDKILSTTEEIVATDRDYLKSMIKNEIVKLTNYNSHNLFSIPLMCESNQVNGNMSFEHTYRSILIKAESHGLYIDKKGILMTSQFIKHLADVYPKQFKVIKTATSLKECFGKEDKVFYVNPTNGDLNKMNIFFTKTSNFETEQVGAKYGLYWQFINENKNMEEGEKQTLLTSL